MRRTQKNRIRPSSLSRGRFCPGSTQLLLVPGLSHVTEAMERGRIAHKWLELMVTEGRQAAIDSLPQTVGKELRLELLQFWRWYQNSVHWLYPPLAGCSLEGIGKPGKPPDGVTVAVEAWIDAAPAHAEFISRGMVDMWVSDGETIWVTDYKLSMGGPMIGRIEEDRQMFAYAAAVYKDHPEAKKIVVWRIAILSQRVESLSFEGADLALVGEAVQSELRAIWEARETFTPGAHCQGCPAARACETYQKQASAISATELVPYEGGAIENSADALRFLLAEPVLAARLEQGKAAVREWIDAHGPVYDPASGKTYQKTETGRDTIPDARACLQVVSDATDPIVAMSAVSTTKGAIEKALKGAGLAPKERRAVFGRLREQGALIKEPQTRWGWK